MPALFELQSSPITGFVLLLMAILMLELAGLAIFLHADHQSARLESDGDLQHARRAAEPEEVRR